MFSSYRQTGRLKTRQLFLLLFFLLAVLLLASWQVRLSSAAADEPPLLVDLLPEEMVFDASLLPGARERQQGEPVKMDGTLARLADENKKSPDGALDFVLNSDLEIANGRVQVRLISTPDQLQAAEKAVTAAGGEVTVVSELEPELQAWIPLDQLESVAADTAVAFIAQPSYLVELDVNDTSATSEGLAALNVFQWHNAGQRGAGVRIAIIDGGFLGYPGLLGTDLPGSVIVKNFVDGQSDDDVDGGSRHGTACAEIAADIVPDAQFYLLKIATNLDLEQAVNFAINQGVDVISTSVGWYNLTPGDGTGQFANLATLARNNGILWATATGNEREAHWGGQFNDPDGDGLHNFRGSQNVNFFGPGDGKAYAVPAGSLLSIFARWDDWNSVNQDYTLHLVAYVNGAWQLVDSSERPQTGLSGQSPTEDLVGVTRGSVPWGFAIERIKGNRNVNLEIFAPKIFRLDEVVHERSLPNLADAPDLVTVGAVAAGSPYSIKVYSAQGPTNGPGGMEFGGFLKPDIVAYTDVSTQSYGPGNFGGTSASAPHVAGGAALVKGANPQFSPQQIQNLLQNRAVDMGPPGMDSRYGYGRAFLGNPPSSTIGLDNHAYLPIIG